MHRFVATLTASGHPDPVRVGLGVRMGERGCAP